ncbi:MAG: response regulator transcription factor [Arcobacteraceae bacterium]
MKKYKLLYAEDDENIRKRYLSILGNYFQEICEASNGKEAYEIYLKEKPDLLIVDINMPLLNGLELTKKIRENNQNIPVIVLSALSSQEVLIEACSLKLVKYLLKPIKTSDLINTIQLVIDELNSGQNQTELVKINESIKFDRDTLLLYVENKQIKLTKNEINLLNLLVKNKNKIVTYEMITDALWDDTFFSDSNNKLRVLVYRLNKKISIDIISSTYGIGYRLKM